MVNSKLLQLIKTFDTSTEYTSFTKFINSPYFNKKKELILLFDLVAKITKKKKKNATPKKEDCFNKIFPNESFDERKWERLKSQLVNLVLEFWQIEKLKNSDRLQNLASVDALDKRHFYKINHNLISKRIEKIKKESSLKADDHLDLFVLYQDAHIYPHNNRFNRELDNVQSANKHLNSFFILSKLHLACELTNRQIALEQDFSIPLLNEVESFICPQLLKEHPIIEVYQKLLELKRNGFEINKYYELETLFFKYKNSITPRKRKEILLLLINFHIRLLNKGDLTIQQSLFELYEKSVESNILCYNNTITNETFTNITLVAASLKKFDWVKKFIQSYSKCLPELIRKNAITYAHGNIAFYEGDFSTTIEILSKYKYDKSIYDTLSRFMVIKSLFELMDVHDNVYERLLQTTEAFIKYIDHRPFGEDRIKSYKNFARLVRRIAKRKRNNYTLEEINAKFEKEIKGELLIKGKAWLLEKIQPKNKNVATN